jgi:hypothetical protein
MNKYTCNKCGKVSVKYSQVPVMQAKCCDGDNLVEHKNTPNAQPPQIPLETVTPATHIVVDVPEKQITQTAVVQKQNTAKSMQVTAAVAAPVKQPSQVGAPVVKP